LIAAGERGCGTTSALGARAQEHRDAGARSPLVRRKEEEMRPLFELSLISAPSLALVSLLGLQACSSASENISTVGQAINAGDDLTEAFNTFQAQVTAARLDTPFRIGYGPHPGLTTESLKGATGFPTKGQAALDFDTRRVTATLDDGPASGSFDLYFVKNVEGSGKTVAPESTDVIRRVGGFTASTNASDPANRRVLDVTLSETNIKFDFDLIVVTRAGSSPATSRIAVGARTLMEKRLFRSRFGQSAPSVTADCSAGDTSARCQLSSEVESLDPLVRRGAQLFFKETFGGNGRTCGSCHRAENNLTIDPQFISTLPASDPLFIAEFTPALAQLEDSALLRQQGLIRENTDGFDKAAVLRGVPHTFAMQTLVGANNANFASPLSPPDHLTGWGGDGAPGRGTIAEFAFGAIVQHATKDLRRRPGTDFRIPTQAELDALEAFQLFTGRQKFVDATVLTLKDSLAQRGRELFLGFGQGGKCAQCHTDMGAITPFGTAPLDLSNFNFNTGVQSLTPNLPVDDGFLSARSETGVFVPSGDFNTPVVIEAADTGPFFHNNVFLSGIEGAVSFYTTPAFQASPLGQILNIQLTQADINDIGAFLRALNAAENIRQIRKRVVHVRDVRASGNTAVLAVAIADCQDALDDLQQRKTGDNTSTTTPLNPSAIQALQTIKLTLETASANADANRPAFMSNALVWLDLAKQDLFSANPNNDF
jgi:cytochrome c peroxidase